MVVMCLCSVPPSSKRRKASAGIGALAGTGFLHKHHVAFLAYAGILLLLLFSTVWVGFPNAAVAQKHTLV